MAKSTSVSPRGIFGVLTLQQPQSVKLIKIDPSLLLVYIYVCLKFRISFICIFVIVIQWNSIKISTPTPVWNYLWLIWFFYWFSWWLLCKRNWLFCTRVSGSQWGFPWQKTCCPSAGIWRSHNFPFLAFSLGSNNVCI